MSATQRLRDYATAKAIVDNALDESGIGHDVGERFNKGADFIAEFCAKLQARAMRQHFYNLTTNVPTGIYRTVDATGLQALKSGLAGAIGELVQWGIEPALEIAADIAEDVNAHSEAKAIRDMMAKV